AGDFDLRGFEITRSEFFENTRNPNICFYHKKIKFNTACVRKFDKNNIELLINPISRKFAIRPTTPDNRNGVIFSKLDRGKYFPKDISTAAFSETVYSLFGWNTDYKYRVLGSLYEHDGEIAYIFDMKDSEAYFKTYVFPTQGVTEEGKPVVQPLMPSGKRIRAIPVAWTNSFGKEFYVHERSLAELERQSEEDWMLRLKGQIVTSGEKCKITGFAEIKAFIQEELNGLDMEETKNAR
ncbi:MAG: recombinase family protein, partial [Oscillospiraceae bacterium]|nr:recombinase family protein [Oscillospiraceae bacterium]